MTGTGGLVCIGVAVRYQGGQLLTQLAQLPNAAVHKSAVS